MSGGNFANDPERAAEAGRKGGQQTGRGNRNEQQRADQPGQTRQTGVENDDDGSSNRRGGNFADDPERAAEAGRKGGRS